MHLGTWCTVTNCWYQQCNVYSHSNTLTYQAMVDIKTGSRGRRYQLLKLLLEKKLCWGVFRMLSNIYEDNSCKKIHYKCLIECLDMRLINLEKWTYQALIIEKMQAAQLCNHLEKEYRSLFLCLSTWISGSRRRWDTITSGITKLLPKISKVCQWNIMSIS